MHRVSVVIVCMNRLDILRPCLDSIRKYTRSSYEVFVVAYMFSEENLATLRRDYPWVAVILSNELRGFSENNNLALKQASGEFCFIVNDDTFMEMPVIDLLIEDFGKQPSASVISPNIVYPDGRPQSCGRGPFNARVFMKHYLHVRNEVKPTKYTMREGLFRTYGLNGACFMIRTGVFREVGFFDETYTFTPEDIALGEMLNRKGYEVWADRGIKISHIANATASRMETAIKPTRVRGSLILYSSLSHLKNPQVREHNRLIWFLLAAFVWLFEAMRGLKYLFLDCSEPGSRNWIMSRTARNVRRCAFSRKSTKEIFTTLYRELYP